MIYLLIGLLSTLEYLYVFRCDSASSVRHSAAATPITPFLLVVCSHSTQISSHVMVHCKLADSRHDAGTSTTSCAHNMGSTARKKSSHTLTGRSPHDRIVTLSSGGRSDRKWERQLEQRCAGYPAYRAPLKKFPERLLRPISLPRCHARKARFHLPVPQSAARSIATGRVELACLFLLPCACSLLGLLPLFALRSSTEKAVGGARVQAM